MPADIRRWGKPFSKRWPGYPIAFFSTVAVAAGRYVFDRAFGGAPHFLLPFVVPVMLAAWFGGGRGCSPRR